MAIIDKSFCITNQYLLLLTCRLTKRIIFILLASLESEDVYNNIHKLNNFRR